MPPRWWLASRRKPGFFGLFRHESEPINFNTMIREPKSKSTAIQMMKKIGDKEVVVIDAKQAKIGPMIKEGKTLDDVKKAFGVPPPPRLRG